MPRFLFSGRWLLGHVLVIAVAALFVRLGLWQLDRLEERRAHTRLVTERSAAVPAPVEDVVPPGGDAGAVVYRSVEATGAFDTGREVILFGRTLEGRPGNHVLTPLVLNDGRAVIVDRGWVPIELDDPPIVDAAPPSGEVRVQGILFPSEPPEESEGPTETIGRIDLGRLAEQLPYPVLPVYVWPVSQEPGQSGELPALVALPELEEGPHLSYAIQWFSFAVIGIVGWGLLLRRETRDRKVP